jgi:hypothetical protein
VILPRHIVERIHATILELKPSSPFHVDGEAQRYGGIALMGTIGATWILRPDGTFLDVDSDSGKPAQPLDAAFHTTALVAGTERYQWLAELLPQRPFGARDCSCCLGRGRLYLTDQQASSEGVFCPECSALGWTASS